MKTFAQYLFLALLSIAGYTVMSAQAHPQFDLTSTQICIFNNGPFDNCEDLNDQLIVIDFDQDGFTLSGYDFPYPAPLSTTMDIPYMTVHDDPIIAMGINGAYLEIAFAASGTTAYNLDELGQIGLFMENGKTAVLSRSLPQPEVTSKIFQQNPCSTMSIYIDSQRRVMGERGNGVGTILVLSELIDSTMLPPMYHLKSGSTLALGDPFGNAPLELETHEAGIPLMFPAYVDFMSEEGGNCNLFHAVPTTSSCINRFSQFARFYVENNYLVVRDLVTNAHGSFLDFPHYFKIGTGSKDRVFIYYDSIAQDIVVWKYGYCGIV